MDGHEAASDLLDDLAAAIEIATAGTARLPPAANIALAMRYVEATYELDRLEQRAVGCCAYLREGLSAAWSNERVEVARRCAVEAIVALRDQVALTPLTHLAASLSEF